jgi:hypothetical protein
MMVVQLKVMIGKSGDRQWILDSATAVPVEVSDSDGEEAMTVIERLWEQLLLTIHHTVKVLQHKQGTIELSRPLLY